MAEQVSPEIIPGVSITQFHFAWNDASKFDGEIHCAHYPDGVITEEPQFYLIRRAVPELEASIAAIFHIFTADFDVISSLLGNYRWVRYIHPGPGEERGYIYVDYPALFGKQRWPVQYFGS